jgi:hypothetical protein
MGASGLLMYQSTGRAWKAGYDDDWGDPPACTAKATVHVGMMAAALVINAVWDRLMDRPTARSATWCAKTWAYDVFLEDTLTNSKVLTKCHTKNNNTDILSGQVTKNVTSKVQGLQVTEHEFEIDPDKEVASSDSVV